MTSKQELSPKRAELLYPDELGMKEITRGIGTRMIIPNAYLFPRQSAGEYGQRKRQQIEAEFKRNPHYLADNPIIATALEYENSTIVVIIDGHHRVRYGPKYGIREIPSIVLSMEELVYVLNMGEVRNNPVTLKSVKGKIEREILAAQESFTRRGMSDSKLPMAVPSRKNIPELLTFFTALIDNK